MNSRARVLVVEDEVLVRLDIAGALRDAGFDVVEAGSGNEALSVLKTGASFVAVVSDVNLNDDVNGIDVIRRARELLPEAKLVLISGSPLLAEAADLPDEFISKPLVAAELAAKLKKAVPDQWKQQNRQSS